MPEFRLPKLGADMTQGRLVEWLKQPGQRVARGEGLAVIETDKANVEVEAFANGVLERVLVQPSQDWLPVGTPLAVITEAGAATPRPPGPASEAAQVKATGQPTAARAPDIPPPVKEETAAARRAEKAAAVAPESPRPPVTPPPAAARQPAPPTSAQTLPPAAREASASREEIPSRTTPAPPPAGVLAEAERLRISPAARKRARERGIDPTAVRGSGPGGRIVLADIEEASTAPREKPGVAAPAAIAPGAGAGAPDKRARMREAIAAAMARSKREIPHYYLGTTIDMSRASAWLAAENATRTVTERLLPAVLLLKAVALALREVPELNGFFVDGRAETSNAVHLGVAISLRGGGLVAPALLDADQRSLTELMHAFRDLVQRARAGNLRGAEITSPTVTVTSLGDRGVESVYGVIYPPQVALVGFGRVLERPWAIDGALAVRPVVRATLSADHRVSDGHRGGLFLDAVARLLQEPEKL